MKAMTLPSLALALSLLPAAAQATSLAAPIAEATFSSLGLPALPHGRYEASGVHYQNGYLYVIFDNSYRVLKMTPSFTSPVMSASTVTPDTDSQFESITFDARGTTHFYVSAETTSTGKIEEFNAALTSRTEQAITGATTFTATNTEYEGLAWVWHCSPSDPNGDDYLLALCEGNYCTGGASGHGKVQVLRQNSATTPTSWAAINGSPISLPITGFTDYSDIALSPAYPATCDCASVCANATGRYDVAVVSQESSKLWIGTLDTTTWTFSGGTVYDFPKDNLGNTVYCNVEGVTFLPNHQIAVVSDAMKNGQDPLCATKEQTVSIFTLP